MSAPACKSAHAKNAQLAFSGLHLLLSIPVQVSVPSLVLTVYAFASFIRLESTAVQALLPGVALMSASILPVTKSATADLAPSGDPRFGSNTLFVIS